jgi:ribonuclease HI
MRRLPLSAAEKELAYVKHDHEGVRLYTSIGGFSGSSTRTELAAGIIGICAWGPVHIGSDSEVFVNNANNMLHNIKHNIKPKVPWKLMHDGDLWEHFYKAATTKSSSAIKLTWVKGHATQKHIDNQVTTMEKKIGNDKADKTADMGTAMHGEDLTKLAAIFHDRHKCYENFMVQVSQHIVEGYLIHGELTSKSDRENAERLHKSDPQVHFQSPTYPREDVDTINLQPKCNIQQHPKFCKAHFRANDAQKYICNLQFVKDKGTHRSTTWLELLHLVQEQRAS